MPDANLSQLLDDTGPGSRLIYRLQIRLGVRSPFQREGLSSLSLTYMGFETLGLSAIQFNSSFPNPFLEEEFRLHNHEKQTCCHPA